MRSLVVHSLVAALGVLPALAQAADVHAGDIEISVEGQQLVVDGALHAHGVTGYKIFEADFGDLGGGPFRTDDPGYDSAAGTFAAGAIVNYRALGSLSYWNGSGWNAAVPSSEYVKLDGNYGEETFWGASGVYGADTGLVGQAGSNGKLHEHLQLSVARTGGGAPAVGAYLIQLQLTSDVYTDSTPFYIAFNRGLDEAGFENAVHALAQPVPEPETYALMLAGLGVIPYVARRRRRSV